jgi:transposase
MEKVSIIGLDLAKRSFQAHGARADGGVGFRKKLSREKVLAFLAERSSLGATGGAISELGHDVRLIPRQFLQWPLSPRKRQAKSLHYPSKKKPALKFARAR